MDEIGIVKSIDGITARVMISRRNSCCESCKKDACDIPDNGIETEAINKAGAKVGQRVKVSLNPYTYLKGAMAVYILPVFALIAGAVVGKMHLAPYFAGVDPDLIAAMGGFMAFFASLILLKIITSRMNRKTEYKSVIESVVEG